MGEAQITRFKSLQKYVLGSLCVAMLGLMGCQPRDVNPRYGTVEAGKVGSIVTDFRDVKSPSKNFDFPVNYIEVKDRPGEQLSTCTGGSWNDIRIHDRSKKEVVYKSIYSGQRVAVAAGASNCHKVGMRVRMSSVTDGSRSNYGHAIVTRLMLLDRSELTPEMMLALDINDFALNSMLRESQTLSILVFKYVEGSAPQEQHFLNSDVVVPNGVPDGQAGSMVASLEELDSPSKEISIPSYTEAALKIGDKLSTCTRGGWNDLRVYDKKDAEIVYAAIYGGKMMASLNRVINCHTVGMRIALTSQNEARADKNLGAAVVTGLYIVNVSDLTDEILTASGFDQEGLQRFLKPGETQVSIMTFKYLRGTGPDEAQYVAGGIPAATEATSAQGETASGTANAPNATVSGDPVTDATSTDGLVTPVNSGSGTTVLPSAPAAAFTQSLETFASEVSVVEYINRKALLSTCSTQRAWTDFRSFRKYDAQMIAGQRKAAITKGKNNCYQPTDVLNIYTPDGSAAYQGQVVIREVFVMRAADLTDEIIAATAQPRQDIETYIGTEEWVHVTVFEYVPYTAALASESVDENNVSVNVFAEGNVASRPGHVLSACNAQANPMLLVSAQEEALFASSPYKKAYVLAQTPCWAVGSVVTLTHVETGALVLDQKVRLTRVELKTIAEVTAEDLSQMGYADITELKLSLSLLWGRPVAEDQVVTLVFVRN